MINDLGPLANQLIKIRQALVIEDYEEAYHQLYLIADPNTEKIDPWAEIESLAEDEELNESKEYNPMRYGTKLSPTCAEEALAFKLIDDAKKLLNLSRLPRKTPFWNAALNFDSVIQGTKELKSKRES